MVLAYTNERMNVILREFNAGRVAKLRIKTEDDGVYLDYNMVGEFQAAEQHSMKKILDERLSQRVRITNWLNEFVEQMALDNVKSVDFEFTIIGISYIKVNYTYDQKNSKPSPQEPVEEKSPSQRLEDAVKNLDTAIRDLGVSDMEIPGIYLRTGAGKNRKYTPQTLGDITGYVEAALNK